MRSKTFILGLLGVVLLIIVGGTMYFFFGNKSKKAQPQPQAAASQVKLLVGGPVVSPILSFNGETVWFMTKDGKMFRKALEGTADKEEYTLPAPVENLIRIFWPKDGADFIVEQNVNGHYGHKFFDPQSKTLIDYDEKVVHPR